MHLIFKPIYKMDNINISQNQKNILSPKEKEKNIRILAANQYQDFLLTDLMVKGSFLLFNFRILLQETQKRLEELEKDKDTSEN